MMDKNKIIALAVGTATAFCGMIAYYVYVSKRKKEVFVEVTMDDLWSEVLFSGDDPEPKETSSNKPNKEKKKVLVLGLQGSGKSAIVASLCGNKPKDDFAPTDGFNVVSTEHLTNENLEVWEVGGNKKSRKYWSHFLNDTDLMLFVVDSTSAKKISDTKEVLNDLLLNITLANVTFVVVANKQDAEGALELEQISKDLDLHIFPASERTQIVATFVPYGGRHGGVDNLKRIIQDKL